MGKQRPSFIRRISALGTWIDTKLNGVRVGRDDGGNIYYRARTTPQGVRERRWVIYNGETDASCVSAMWHGWLHHMTNEIPDGGSFAYAWQKPHQQNLTGTTAAYAPPRAHSAAQSQPAIAGGYEAWNPEETH